MAASALFLAACNNKATVNTTGSDSAALYLKKIKQEALSSDSAYLKKDADAVFKDCAPGFIDYGDGISKPIANIDTLKAITKSFFKAFPDFKGENLRAVAEDSTVVVTGTWSGTFKMDFMKMKSTDKMIKSYDADVFTFNKAGKMTSHISTFRLTNIDIKFPGNNIITEN